MNVDSEYDIEIKKDAIQDIMTKVPSWIVRWGITVIFIVMILLIVFSAFIEYPQRVTSSIQVVGPQMNTKTLITSDSMFGFMSLPQMYYSKVKKGQEVIINMDSYPANEYGFIKGYLLNVSDSLSEDGKFNVKIIINNFGVSKQRKKTFINGMTGSGTIILGKESILRKIFHSI